MCSRVLNHNYTLFMCSAWRGAERKFVSERHGAQARSRRIFDLCVKHEQLAVQRGLNRAVAERCVVRAYAYAFCARKPHHMHSQYLPECDAHVFTFDSAVCSVCVEVIVNLSRSNAHKCLFILAPLLDSARIQLCARTAVEGGGGDGGCLSYMLLCFSLVGHRM